MTFEFATAQRIIFGAGRAAEVPGLVSALGRRPLLVCGSDPARVPAGIVAATAGCWSVTGEPTFAGVRAGLQAARALDADVLVAVGGGSVIDSAKALAMLLANGGDPLDYAEVIGAGRAITRPSRPLVAVSTTAGAGAEVTRNAVLRDAEHGLKVSLRSPLMLPAVAVVDPDLTGNLSASLTAATGMDALSQLIEPFLCNRPNPITDALCREGLPRVARALPRAFRDGGDRAARSDMALGALLGGLALANAGLGAVHGFAAAIGGAFTAPHGAVCAALLAPVLALNGRLLAACGSADQMARVGELGRLLLGSPSATLDAAVDWVRHLTCDLGVPGLRAYGVAEAQVPDLCRMAAQASSMKANPVSLSDVQLREILLQSL